MDTREKLIDQLIDLSFAEDIGDGDHTTLSTIGPDAMGAKITSVEGFAGDDHCITMETDGLKVTSDVYSRTAEIAGWSIVSLLQNLASPVVLF